MTVRTLTKKSVAGIGMLVIGDNEGVFARTMLCSLLDTVKATSRNNDHTNKARKVVNIKNNNLTKLF